MPLPVLASSFVLGSLRRSLALLVAVAASLVPFGAARSLRGRCIAVVAGRGSAVVVRRVTSTRSARGLLGWFARLPEPVSRAEGASRLRPWAWLCIVTFTGVVAYASSVTIYAGGQVYSQQQIANALTNSSNSYIAANATSFAAASHNVEDPNGNTGTYNGSCCTGLFQINRTNLTTFCNCTRAQFATYTLDQQVAVYSALVTSEQGSLAVSTLLARQASGGTLGGQPVNGATIVACIQQGPGNCQKAINNDCSSVKLGQGGDNYVNPCTFAAKANAGPQVAPDGSTTAGTTPIPKSTAPSTASANPPATTPPASSPPSSTNSGGASGSTDSTAQPTAQSGGGSDSASAGSPKVNLNLSNYNPQDQSGTQEFTVGDPKLCWICNGAMYALGVVEVVATTASPAIVTLMWPLIVVLFGVALMITVGTAVVAGQNPWVPMIRMLARMAVVGAILGGWSIASMGSDGSSAPSDPSNGGTDYSYALPVAAPDGSYGAIAPKATSSGGGSLLFDYVLGPPITAGAEIGAALAHVASGALGVQLQSGNCSYDAAGSSTNVVKLTDASNALMTLLCTVHVAGATGVELGASIAKQSGDTSTQMDSATAVLVSFLGGAIMILSTMAMFNFGFAVIEVVLKVGLLCAFLPIFLFAYLFEMTRPMVRSVVDAMLFSFFYLLATGLSSVVSVYVMMEGFSFGLGQNGASVDSAGLLSQFATIGSSLNLQTGDGLAKVALLVGFSLSGCLLSSRMLRSTQDMAAELTGFALGRSGEIAAVGSKLVSVGVQLGAVGGGVAASLGGRVVGAALGRAVGRSAPRIAGKAFGR